MRVELSGDEALVLFEWLARFNELGDSAFKDEAEQEALWHLEHQLEKRVAAVLDPRYPELLDEARARIRDASEA